MNKSFQLGQSEHYLPPITRNQSASISKTYRSQSSHEIVGSINVLPKKYTETENLRNVQQYESMNEKELLREHEVLLKILKKYQDVLDVSIAKKQKQRQKQAIQKNKKQPQKKFTKEQLMTAQIVNNKKIIQNHLRQIKELQSAQKHRKLNQVLQQKAEVAEAISKVKKQIFEIKNRDTMASKDLLTNRELIQKQLHDAQKDLKTQLTKNSEYRRKIQQLTEQLKKLKSECSSINISEMTAQAQQKDYVLILAEKKMELQQAQKNYTRTEESIQQVMVNKTKRNKGIQKQIQGMNKKITQLNNKIQIYKQKVTRYQKAIEQSPGK